jgi:hypothetical protein
VRDLTSPGITVIHIFRVPYDKVTDWRRINLAARRRYLACGALSDDFVGPMLTEEGFGTRSLATMIGTTVDDLVYAEIVRFRDRAHYDEVNRLLDADEELGTLFDEAVALFAFDRIVSGAFDGMLVDA